MTETITISHCVVCGRELKDPIPDFGTGYFQLNDGGKICEYCYMGAYVDGYDYDRDGNKFKIEEDQPEMGLMAWTALILLAILIFGVLL